MAPRPRAILLDLDGTLIDSEPGILASAHAALRGMGHEPDGLDIKALIGPPPDEVMRTVLARYGDDRVAEAIVAYREHYGSTGLLASAAYPGIAEALARLAAEGAKLYVATSKRTVFAARILDRLGLAAHFAAIHGSEPGGALDDKAALIADILERHALAPDRCLMVGDRRQDILGAHANGASSVGVLWGYGEREELEAAGAHRIIARPDELAGP